MKNTRNFNLWAGAVSLGVAGWLAVSCASSSGGRSQPAASAGGTAQPAMALFNGRNLSGWKAVSADPKVPMEKVWRVQDGIIICSGEPMGYLHTKQVFTDYRLELEYRWAPGKTPGNSGLFGRINGAPRALPRCIETQLRHGNAGDLYGFHGMKINGPADRFRFVPNHQLGGDLRGVTRMAGNEKPAGEWNHVVVLAQGPRVQVWMNGQLVNEATDVEVVPGPVGLQSEGGEIHFRNIHLMRLAP
ncbi:DUF1080 domain-containing protein [Fontisphaera persica]|uniref:3-keto-disaccharide hydrolase n=1 Tax=Fontisphaera persica TaxID=2974023 RepID=UPI0024BFF6AA|nr:DUF1080 domain-containing protein [Fontisphaera persica]WCJ59183.1 DUF1080 domain-containing protein [Fontisphaera persica]